MFVSKIISVHSVVAEKTQSGPKWWLKEQDNKNNFCHDLSFCVLQADETKTLPKKHNNVLDLLKTTNIRHVTFIVCVEYPNCEFQAQTLQSYLYVTFVSVVTQNVSASPM